VPDPVAGRVRAGFPRLLVVAQAEETGPGGDADGDVRGDDPAAVDLPGLRGSLSCPVPPSWAMPGFRAPAGIWRMASSSVMVIIQPQVNGRARRSEDRDSRCLASSWLAPAPPTRMRILRRNRAGTCPIAAASTSLWPVNVSEPALPRAQQHGQALADTGEPGARGPSRGRGRSGPARPLTRLGPGHGAPSARSAHPPAPRPVVPGRRRTRDGSDPGIPAGDAAGPWLSRDAIRAQT
jgi:hypothetical protein